jgi:hypothetical protein
MTMNKEFEYAGYRFITSVELSTRKEKKLNGKVWHTITTDCTEGTYYVKDDIETYEIEDAVARHELSAIEYIDKLTSGSRSFEETLLTKLGFS